MLQPLKSASQYKVKSASIPAPFGGLNSRDSVDFMKPTDAIVMSNFFPTVEKVTLREGYTSFCTGIGSGDVETVVEHNAGSNRQLLAIGSNGTLYQINTGSAVSRKTGLSNGRSQTAAFNGRTLFANGAEQFSWDGSSAADISLTLSDSSAQGTLKGVHAHKNRVYWWRGTDQSFYYSASVDTFSGNVTLFNLGVVADKGGNIVSMATITIDGGEGLDDLLAIILSSGQVLVYSGSNPGSGFSLIGTFRIAEPVNEARCVAKFGGDVAVSTKEGYIALSQVMKNDVIGTRAAALSEKIRGTVIAQVASTGSTTGWQTFVSPDGTKIYFNYPTGDGTDPYNQHVFNPIINAWCVFEAIPARVWGSYNGDTYFGGASGVVYKMGGTADVDAAITGDVATAYNYFGDRASLKRFSSVAPMLEASTTVSFDFGIAVDQEPVSALNLSTTSFASELATWDTATWDEFHWSDQAGAGITQRRKSTSRLGRSAAVRIKVATSTQSVSFISANFTYLPGGPF